MLSFGSAVATCYLVMERYYLLLSQFNFENNNETQWPSKEMKKKQAIVVVFHYKSVILKNFFPDWLNRIKANKKSSRFQRSWADAKCLLNMLDTQWSTICDIFYFIFEDGLFHDPIKLEISVGRIWYMLRERKNISYHHNKSRKVHYYMVRCEVRCTNIVTRFD